MFSYVGCDICDAFIITNGFENEESLRRHTDVVHGDGLLVNSKDKGPFNCPFCEDSSFIHRKGMIEHLQVSKRSNKLFSDSDLCD